MFSWTVIWGWWFMIDLLTNYWKQGGLWCLEHWYIFLWIVVLYFVFIYLYELLRDFILKKL